MKKTGKLDKFTSFQVSAFYERPRWKEAGPSLLPRIPVRMP